MSNNKVPWWGTDGASSSGFFGPVARIDFREHQCFGDGGPVYEMGGMYRIPIPNSGCDCKGSSESVFCKAWLSVEHFYGSGTRLFKSICEILQIHKSRTTTYRPSANGQVERFNRTLMDAVRCFVDKSQDNWDEHLSQLARAIRSSWIEARGSPRINWC